MASEFVSTAAASFKRKVHEGEQLTTSRCLFARQRLAEDKVACEPRSQRGEEGQDRRVGERQVLQRVVYAEQAEESDRPQKEELRGLW